MSLLDKMKSGYDKAKEGVSDLAETTKIKHEINKLTDRKTELYTQIGQKVCVLWAQGQTIPEVQAEWTEVKTIEDEIKRKGEEIARVNLEHS